MTKAERVREDLPILFILLSGGVLRLWGLDWLPSAAGDEGNWTLYALQILDGQRPSFASDAAFVSMLYAHLMAAAMKFLGLTFLAARLPNALAGILTAAGAYWILLRLGSRRGALAAAMVLSWSPWSVLYSRICSVPYVLALAVMTLGPLLFAAGVLKRRRPLVVAGVFVVSLGAHFSPLCGVAAAACALYCVAPSRRWVWRSWDFYAAAVLALIPVYPIVSGAMRVAAATDLPFWSNFGWRIWNYVHMVGTGLMGEASLRHFTSHALPAGLAGVLILPTTVLLIGSVRVALRGGGVLAGFGALYFLAAFLLTPAVLGAGRDWHMPYNHSDRYLFAFLPAFVFCLADLAHGGGRWWRVGVAAAVVWMALGTARSAHTFLFGSGGDKGEMIFDGGGGYRGWLVSDRPRNTLFQIRDHVLEEAGRGGAALLVADRVFIPMEFVMQGTGVPVFDVRRRDFPPVASGRYLVLVWPDSVLSVGDPPTAPPRYVGGNERLRRRMNVLFQEKKLVRRFVQRDGSPLLELWLAESPRGRFAAQIAAGRS